MALALALGPLFEGFSRKYVKAQVAHSRVGPLVGVWQPFVDLAKLLGKEDLGVGNVWLQRVAPIVCLGSALCASLLVPIAGKAPLGGAGDFIVFIYVVGIAAVAMILAGFASASPYTYTGATREMMLYLIVEPVLVIVLIGAAVNAHSLSFEDIIAWHLAQGPTFSLAVGVFALLLAIFAQFGKLPFDIAEADQEIMGGPFAELSGPKLALIKWAIWVRQFVFAAVLASVFVPWPRTGMVTLDAVITVAKIFVVFLIGGLVEVVNPRLRIDQALAFYLSVILAAAVSVVLAFVGA